MYDSRMSRVSGKHDGTIMGGVLHVQISKDHVKQYVIEQHNILLNFTSGLYVEGST